MIGKLKRYIFIISITYSVLIIFFMIFNICNSVSHIELYDSEDNIQKLNILKKEINNLENNDCKLIINELVNYYEKTSYNGLIKLKDIYDVEQDKGLLSYYVKSVEKCSINESNIKKYNLPFKFLTASIQQNELLQNYYFQYELNFKDIITRYIVEPDIHNVEYKISKTLQLEIITNLIEISRGSINE